MVTTLPGSFSSGGPGLRISRAARPAAALLSAVVSLSRGAYAQPQVDQPPAPSSKGEYSLWNPVPEDKMRAFATDRPDISESPISVDAGHFQLEMSFVEWEWTEDSRNTAVAPFNLKAGVSENTDFQVVAEPYDRDVEKGVAADGTGDLSLRVKHNLFGNDSGKRAIAIMPYVTLPTGSPSISDRKTGGGIIVPSEIELDDHTELGLQVEAEYTYDGEEGRYYDFLHTAALWHDLNDTVSVFGEYAGRAATDSGIGYRPFVNTGFTVNVDEDVAFDAGAIVGLDERNEGVTLYTGVSIRR